MWFHSKEVDYNWQDIKIEIADTKDSIISRIEGDIQKYITLCIEEWAYLNKKEINERLVENYIEEWWRWPDGEERYIEHNEEETTEDMFWDENWLESNTDFEQLQYLFKIYGR